MPKNAHFRRGAFSTETSVSKMQHSTYKRLNRIQNNFDDAPWTLSKLEWFRNNFNDGNSIFLYFINMSLIFFFTAKQSYTYLASLGWVPSSGKCPICTAPMALIKREAAIDGLTWHCYNKTSKNKKKATPCGTRVSVRDGTWASKAHLSFSEIIQFTLLWYQK